MAIKTKNSALKIGYILKMYPRFSETFIVNEILELERQGVNIHIFSLTKPEDGQPHKIVSMVKAPVTYLSYTGTSDFWKHMQSNITSIEKHREGYGQALWNALKFQVSSTRKYFILAALIAEKLRKMDINHLHAHFGTSPAHVAMLTSMMTGIPYSFTAHAKDIYHEDVNPELLREKIMNSAFTITVCDYNIRHIKALCGRETNKKLRRIYNGIDLELFKTDSGVEKNYNTIISASRLIEKKGFSVLIKACKILKNRNQKFKCRIIGKGELKEELKRLILSEGLEEQVMLEGPQPLEKLVNSMRKSSFFVLPCVVGSDGNRDALPTVLLEAMAIGLPVISTDITGIPEIIDHNINGCIVPQNNAHELAMAMEKLLLDREYRLKLARASRVKVETRFDIRKNVSQVRKLFEHSSNPLKRKIKKIFSLQGH